MGWFRKRRPKIGLALGGGGARGVAHIGVLQVFEDQNIPIDLIVGTSAGALFGGMYCQLESAREVEEKLRRFLSSVEYEDSGLRKVIRKQENENVFTQFTSRLKERIVLNVAQSRTGLVRHERLRNVVDYLLLDQDIQDCKIPFAAVAVDLIKGREVVFTSGSIRLAVDASSSLPGYFAPVDVNGQMLVDGAVLQVVPVPAARQLGADVVIAVNVSQDLESNPELDNVIKIIYRSSSITNHRYNQSLLQKADVIIRPDVGHLHWSEFDNFEKTIYAGKKAAEAALPYILKKIQKRNRWFLPVSHETGKPHSR